MATVSGYAVVFNQLSVDLGGFKEKIAPFAFDDLLRTEFDTIACLEHDPGMLLGRTASGTLKLSKDSTGLHFTLRLPDTTLGRDVRELVARGDLAGASFRFSGVQDRWFREGNIVIRDVRRIGRLTDISLVALPAYPQTSLRLSMAERSARTTDDRVANLLQRLERAEAELCNPSLARARRLRLAVA